MADDRVKISALDSASTMDTGDLFPVTQERGGTKKTNKATMSQIAAEVVNGIEEKLHLSQLGTVAQMHPPDDKQEDQRQGGKEQQPMIRFHTSLFCCTRSDG